MVHVVTVIVVFFVAHWVLSVTMQTFFLHRYAAHRMFTLSPGWERFFHVLTLVSQGSSYLQPRGYALLHREHHAFSDTERDPHSPHTSRGLVDMMWKTAQRYHGLNNGSVQTESRFEGGLPSWPALEAFGDHWATRVAFGLAYSLVYVVYAPHWAWFLLLPVHFLMGPVHGAIVNWGGHKYGYRNFNTNDKSRNTLPFDFLAMGELFQNNHHHRGQRVNFAARWFELDPTYMLIKALSWVGVVKLEKPRSGKAQPATEVLAPSEPLAPELASGG